MTQTKEVIKLIDTNKARLAFLVPFITALGAAFASWVISGEFNDNEIRTAIGGTVLAAVGSIGAYLAPAGQAEVSS